MPQTEIPFAEILVATGDGAPTIEEKMHLLQQIRRHAGEGEGKIDRFLLENIAHLHNGLAGARSSLHKLEEVLDKLGAVPWHPAVYLGPVMDDEGPRAMVSFGNGRRVLGVAEGLSLESLQVGDEVLLGSELNVVMARSPFGIPSWGETAYFTRRTSDGRVLLRCRDEEVVVNAAESLHTVNLEPGDQVRWDRSAWMAYERMESAPLKQYLLDDITDAFPEQVGGQKANLELLLYTLKATLIDPDKAKRYTGQAQRSMLMIGPPGCGKTLMARVVASEIARTAGQRCRFGVVKPAEWEDPYVGVTQQNIRNCFKMLRDTARDGLSILFLDEIDAVGRIRGGVANQHSDKFLDALLAELDGFTDRSNIAIIAASNRKDLVDPALLERLSDVEIQVGRPDLRAAKAIFQIHLPNSLPYSRTGKSEEEVRDEMIETAVSQFYSPNADNALCSIRFRDGKTRTVRARELASGRIFKQICGTACQAALFRDLRTGEQGLQIRDMNDALSKTLNRLKTTLTRVNVHAYLDDLPQDVDVVSIEPVLRKVSQPTRYLNVS